MSGDVCEKDASVKSLCVTIQCLAVNGKQMTLAVFRQLPVAGAVDHYDGNLVPDMKLWGGCEIHNFRQGRLAQRRGSRRLGIMDCSFKGRPTLSMPCVPRVELLGWGRRQKETQSQNPRAISKALGRTPPVVHRGLGGHAIIGIFSEFRCALRVARGNT